MNDINTATKRTTINGTILTAVIIAVANLFGWTIEMADLAPFLPLFAGAILVFYRLSLVVSEKWPQAGYVLVGSKQQPHYPSPPPSA